MADAEDDKRVNIWFDYTPGLVHEVEFMAWVNKASSPIILAAARDFNSQCVPVVVRRVVWDSNLAQRIGLRDTGVIDAARAHFSSTNGEPDRMLVFRGVDFALSGKPCHSLVAIGFSKEIRTVHESVFSTLSANQYAAERVRRELELKSGEKKRFVRLCGLDPAFDKNGREGELVDKAPDKNKRLCIIIGGKVFRAKQENFMPVKRPRLFNSEF
jgi:hypothetical protein